MLIELTMLDGVKNYFNSKFISAIISCKEGCFITVNGDQYVVKENREEIKFLIEGNKLVAVSLMAHGIGDDLPRNDPRWSLAYEDVKHLRQEYDKRRKRKTD